MAEQLTIDTSIFTRLGKTLEGKTPLSRFHRLAEGLPVQEGYASWSVQGEVDTHERAFLDVAVQAELRLVCQRCLSDVLYEVDSQSKLNVVQNQAQAASLHNENLAPDDWDETVIASPALDILELIEDELVLSVPYVPMHEHCTTQALEENRRQAQEFESDKASPFEALRKLKNSKH